MVSGAEKVKVNYSSKKITVWGKVEAAKVKERVEIKTKKPAHLLSPNPNPSNQAKSPVQPTKTDHVDHSNQINPQAIQVSDAGAICELKTRVHCDNCVHKINKIIKKYQGVEDVNVDLEKDKITVKGKMDMEEMLPYLTTKLKRVVKISPPAAVDITSDGGCRKTSENNSKRDPEEKIIKKEAKQKPKTVAIDVIEESSKKLEELTASRVDVVNKMEYNGGNGSEFGTHMYDPQQVQAHGKGHVVEYWNAPPVYTETPSPFYNFQEPLMFSDDNPNAACSIM